MKLHVPRPAAALPAATCHRGRTNKNKGFYCQPGIFTAKLCASGYQKQHKNLPALSQRDQASILLPASGITKKI